MLIGFSIAAIAAAFFVEPVAQDPAYFSFADSRTLLGVPNFWNVMSNIPFLIAGGAGLVYFAQADRAHIASRVDLNIYPAYVIFFLGVFLTCFGSAWFHLAPDDNTLLWDRLPMTLGFMALFTIVIGEHVSPRVARRLLWPLLLTGAGSVFYWYYTELRGAGDLRPYALVQFLPMLLIPIILLAYPSRYSRTRIYWGMLAAYVAAKLFEFFDQSIYDILKIVSGHSIKHVAAAVAPAIFLYGISTFRSGDNAVLPHE